MPKILNIVYNEISIKISCKLRLTLSNWKKKAHPLKEYWRSCFKSFSWEIQSKNAAASNFLKKYFYKLSKLKSKYI